MAWSDRRYGDERGWGRRGDRLEGTYWLLGIIAGCHVLKALLNAMGVVSGQEIDRVLGVTRESLFRGWIWQPITYQFLHAGTGHLIGNLLGVFLIGRFLEAMLGRRRFLGVFLGCGAAASLGIFLPPTTVYPTVGCSGSVLGILLVATALAPNMPVNLIFFSLRLKWLAAIYVAFDILSLLGDGYRVAGSPSGVAHWVHVLGAFSGLVYAWAWPRYVAPAIKDLKRKRNRRREVETLEKSLMEERELDRILAKIQDEGMPSLTDAERRFLKKASTRYQGSKRD